MCALSLHPSMQHLTKAFISIFTLLLLSAFGCANQNDSSRTKFHPLPDLTFVQTERDYYGNSYSVRNDFVVIANPPAEREELQSLVEAYNAKTLSEQQLSQQFGYIRRFYKESTAMPRNYRESHQGYFEIDRWEHHGDDLLIIVKWGKFGKELSYEFP